MNLRNSLITCAAGLAMAGPLALAGPGDKAADKPTSKGATLSTLLNPFASPEQADFTENFDSYTVGQGIAGKGGWELWPGGNDGIVVTTQASSPANSLELIPSSDIVQLFTNTSGVWEFTIQTYTPSSAPEGEGLYIILLNQYGAVNNWSMQIALNDIFSGGQTIPWMIESQWDGAVLPLILDQWVEFKAVIDLDNDTINTFYGGTPLGVDLMWTDNNFSSGPGIPEIAALDLYSAAFVNAEMYLDDVALTESSSCPCACNFNTTTLINVCDIFDFLDFQNGFVNQDPCSCDINTTTGKGVCDIFDFLDFQNGFVAGCP